MLTTQFEAQICYSHFAEHVVTTSFGKRPPNLYQIYHGVDTGIFKPINQISARQQLSIPLDSFIIGMVARNQFRKRYDILIKAFAKFAANKPEAKLYMHTTLQDIGFDIADLVRQNGLNGPERRIILTPDLRPDQGVPEKVLNLIYNSFDINTLISLGDGFGLPVAESMATGCPQVVSGHSCLEELVEGHGGFTVKNAAWIAHTSGINTMGGVSDIDDLVEKWELLYFNRELRVKLAEVGYSYITQPQFQWSTISSRFNSIIKELFHIW